MTIAIAIECEDPDRKFRLSVNGVVVATDLGVVEAHDILGKLLERIARPAPPQLPKVGSESFLDRTDNPRSRAA